MRQIAVFGAGQQAESFVYKYGDLYEIMYMLDFKMAGQKFLGKYDILMPTTETCSKYFIVCACDGYLSTIHNFFDTIQREEFKDYIYYDWDNKKMVVVNANCYGPYIKHYLKTNKEFNDNFYFYPVPAIHANKEKVINDHIMKNCDVFLHQDIRADNNFAYTLSDEYLIPKLSGGKIYNNSKSCWIWQGFFSPEYFQ